MACSFVRILQFGILSLALGVAGLQAQDAAPALSGRVTAQIEGPLEGILITARKAGATFSVTVVSDSKGHYVFRRKDLGPGQYTLGIRAVGYQLESPGRAPVITQNPTSLDLTLRKVTDISAQLTSAEWLASFPGTPDQKTPLLGCTSCHTLERVAKSHHDPQEWMSVFERMGRYFAEDSTARPQVSPGPSRFQPSERLKKQAEYLSTVNLSKVEQWDYPLRAFPRPAGRATRVVITEYDLPRQNAVPHDVATDPDGNVWWSDSGWMYLGKLDPVSGRGTEYPIPVFSPEEPQGAVDVEIDKRGNVWPALLDQGGKFAMFDRKTSQFRYWDVPKANGERMPRVAFLAVWHSDVDGKVWATDSGQKIYRLDLTSGQIETFDAFPNVPGGRAGHLVYQVIADDANNCYFLDWPKGGVGRIDAKNKEVSFYPTPTPNSFSRRGHMDSEQRLWFGEFQGNRIGMFDTQARTFKEIEAPNPWSAPYEAAPDHNGEIWASGHTSDRLLRYNPKTGETTEYLLPRYTDARRIAMQESKGKVVLWLPNKNNAAIVRIEPLD